MANYGTAIYGQSKYGVTIEYIFDRTETDLINNTEKSYINYSDLNRVELGMKEVAEKYGVSIDVKTDWEYQKSTIDTYNFPIKEQMERIINNLNTLINTIGYLSSVDAPVSFENMNIYKMNNMERILSEMQEME